MVLVSSAVGHFEQREAIRWTWASDDNLDDFNVRVIFLLGQGTEQQSLVADESRISRDIVQEDFKVLLSPTLPKFSLDKNLRPQAQ